MAFDYGDDMMDEFQYRPARRGVWPLRFLRPPPAPQPYAQEADLPNPVAQPMPDPVGDGPAAENNDPLDDFYQQWRAEVMQRHPPPPAPVQPRMPGNNMPEVGDVIPGNDDARRGRPRANVNINFLRKKMDPVPAPVLDPPVARPNVVRAPEQPKASQASPLPRLGHRQRRPDRPERAEELRELQEADALLERINQIRDVRAAREARQAEQAADAANARVEAGVQQLQRMQRMARVQAALEQDPMEGVVQEGPARVAVAPPRPVPLRPAASRRYEELHNRLQAFKAAQRRARTPPQNPLAGNNDRLNRRPDIPDLYGPLPLEEDGPIGPPQPPPGLGLEELYQQFNEADEDIRLLERRNRQDLVNAPPNIELPPLPIELNGPHPAPYGPNPWNLEDNHRGPDIANPAQPVNPRPDAIPGGNENQRLNPFANPPNRPHFYDYNPVPRPRRAPQVPDPLAIPYDAYQMPRQINNLNDPPLHPYYRDVPLLQPRQMVGRAAEAAQNREQALAEVQAAELQISQAQKRALAVQAQAQAARLAAGRRVAQQPPQPPANQPGVNPYLPLYAGQFYPGRAERNAAIEALNEAHAGAENAVDAAQAAARGVPQPDIAPEVRFLERMRRINDDALRHIREERARLDAGLGRRQQAQEQVYEPEEVEEEYESDDTVGAGKGEEKV